MGDLNSTNTIPTDPIVTWDEQTTILTGDDIQAPLVDSIGSGSATLFFDDANLSKTFSLHHEAGVANEVYFINDGYTNLKVDIFFLSATETGANLRLSQIIMPDGSMDGPFGTETEYSLTQNGGYQLIFNENMMAGDGPWSGDVTFTISLSK